MRTLKREKINEGTSGSFCSIWNLTTLGRGVTIVFMK